MPEMLTIKQAVQKIKDNFPNSPIKEYAIRQWVKEKKFRVVIAGNKALIDWASFVSFLSGTGA